MPIVGIGTTLKKGDITVANLTTIDGVGFRPIRWKSTNLIQKVDTELS